MLEINLQNHRRDFKMGMLSIGLILGSLLGGFAYMVYDLYLKNKNN